MPTRDRLQLLRDTHAAKKRYDATRTDRDAKVAWAEYCKLVKLCHKRSITPQEVDTFTCSGNF